METLIIHNIGNQFTRAVRALSNMETIFTLKSESLSTKTAYWGDTGLPGVILCDLKCHFLLVLLMEGRKMNTDVFMMFCYKPLNPIRGERSRSKQ